MVIIPDDKQFSYEVIDSRIIELVSTGEVIKPYVNDKNCEKTIIAIEVGDFFIQLEDEFDTKVPTLRSRYLIKHIKSINPNVYILVTHLRNRCTSYILPCLEGNKNTFFFDSFLINAYITENLRYLNLLYRFNTHISYKKMELSLIRHPGFVSASDETNAFVVFKFSIPEEFYKDVELFLSGKYSMFSDNLKSRIKRFNKFENGQKIVQTIFKDKKLKLAWEKELFVKLSEDMELDSIPDKQMEIWDNKLVK